MNPFVENQLTQYRNQTQIVVPDSSSIVEDDTDINALNIWLSSYSANPINTQRVFKQQAFRFLIWLNAVKGMNPRLLPRASVKDLNDYRVFLQNPRPFSPEFLERFGIARPLFTGKPLSRESVRNAFAVLNRMFTELQAVSFSRTDEHIPYVSFNPCVMIKGLKPGPSRVNEKAMSQEQWQKVLETIELLPKDTEKAIKHYHRARWVMVLTYLTYMRRFEIASLYSVGINRKSEHENRSGFQKTSDGEWRIYVVGKGVKEDFIPCTPELMTEFMRYRESLGLPSLPPPSENLPAVLRVTGKGQLSGVDDKTIYNICKTIFFMTANRVEAENPHDAAFFRDASTHWMRHTGITHSLDAGMDPRTVQAVARHSSLAVTAIYDHKPFRNIRTDLERLKAHSEDE